MHRDKAQSHQQVFINCPFDELYRPHFNAIIFTVIDCGCAVRCALEEDDSGTVRIEKIMKMISECRLGIHDISCTELDEVNRLPRFNMPYELGLFLGAKRFGGPSPKQKSCLIMDRERFRYQKFLSDIAGQDIKAHAGSDREIIENVRNWLNANLANRRLPSGISIHEKYLRFEESLPELCVVAGLNPERLTFQD